MKTRIIILIMAFLPAFAWSQEADLPSAEIRAVSVSLAQTLLQPRDFAVKPIDAISPFAPPTFDQADPEELKAQQAAAAAAAAAGVVSRPAGDRAVLEELAERIVPSGILHFGGRAILLFGAKKLKVGDRLTITFDGTNYDLDITAIGATTFTLRYNSEEITRSIKPGKKL